MTPRPFFLETQRSNSAFFPLRNILSVRCDCSSTAFDVNTCPYKYVTVYILLKVSNETFPPAIVSLLSSGIV